jgi:hypothetical protein
MNVADNCLLGLGETYCKSFFIYKTKISSAKLFIYCQQYLCAVFGTADTPIGTQWKSNNSSEPTGPLEHNSILSIL